MEVRRTRKNEHSRPCGKALDEGAVARAPTCPKGICTDPDCEQPDHADCHWAVGTPEQIFQDVYGIEFSTGISVDQMPFWNQVELSVAAKFPQQIYSKHIEERCQSLDAVHNQIVDRLCPNFRRNERRAMASAKEYFNPKIWSPEENVAGHGAAVQGRQRLAMSVQSEDVDFEMVIPIYARETG